MVTIPATWTLGRSLRLAQTALALCRTRTFSPTEISATGTPLSHLLPYLCQQQRWFFKFPAIDSSSGGTKQIFRHTQKVNYTQRELFDIVSDVNEYRRFIPWCKQSTLFPDTVKTTYRAPSIIGGPTDPVKCQRMEAELVVGFQAFEERYTSVVTTEKPWKVTAQAKDGSIFNELKTEWTFRPVTGRTGWTEVSFDIEFEFKSALHAAVSSVVFDSVCQEMVNAFTSRYHQVYGPR
ncbi:Coenzyme Q-binding protein coq10a, mitochondrial [Spiromyces aspiralis]|uniref:Coenzyme Q-binding protein coq10a, mitochondrial n=1 Tax=Spiromyces aspiralis TaxID=68401 RepID=A0ACC1HG55_9FUNG|nr:Coenzyme Q-binding protein coq10a, mitochondrial [Spiromyces aspiralis]